MGEREGRRILRLQGSDDRKYRTIPKISFEGLMYGGKFAFQNRLGWPYSWNEIYRFLYLALYLGAISNNKPPGRRRHILRGDLPKGFCVTSFGGLYFEGLIHGGAYFRNFTVRPTAFPGVSSVFGKWKTQLRAIISRNGMNSGCPAAWLLKKIGNSGLRK